MQAVIPKAPFAPVSDLNIFDPAAIAEPLALGGLIGADGWLGMFAQKADILRIKHHFFAKIMFCDCGGEADETGEIKRHQTKERGAAKEPAGGLVSDGLIDHQGKAEGNNDHPDRGGHAQMREAVLGHVELKAQKRGEDEKDVLRDPGKEGDAQQRTVLREGAGKKREDTCEQSCGKKGIGAAMCVSGICHVIGERDTTPKIGDISKGLEREERVEEDERAANRASVERGRSDRKARAIKAELEALLHARCGKERQGDEGEAAPE